MRTLAGGGGRSGGDGAFKEGAVWGGAAGGGSLSPHLAPQESQASWLDAVVPHLAEVLQLEDTPSIQVEVGVLVRDYPDIR